LSGDGIRRVVINSAYPLYEVRRGDLWYQLETALREVCVTIPEATVPEFERKVNELMLVSLSLNYTAAAAVPPPAGPGIRGGYTTPDVDVRYRGPSPRSSASHRDRGRDRRGRPAAERGAIRAFLGSCPRHRQACAPDNARRVTVAGTKAIFHPGHGQYPEGNQGSTRRTHEIRRRLLRTHAPGYAATSDLPGWWATGRTRAEVSAGSGGDPPSHRRLRDDDQPAGAST
jgi:hypothetical protein